MMAMGVVDTIMVGHLSPRPWPRSHWAISTSSVPPSSGWACSWRSTRSWPRRWAPATRPRRTRGTARGDPGWRCSAARPRRCYCRPDRVWLGQSAARGRADRGAYRPGLHSGHRSASSPSSCFGRACRRWAAPRDCGRGLGCQPGQRRTQLGPDLRPPRRASARGGGIGLGHDDQPLGHGGPACSPWAGVSCARCSFPLRPGSRRSPRPLTQDVSASGPRSESSINWSTACSVSSGS